MKKLLPILLLVAVPLWCSDQDVKTFHGEIADNQCAMNVHSLTRSHKEMLKGKAMGNTSQSCSRMCVKNYGGHYVLQDKDNVYNIDDQKTADIFAGKRVKITGTLSYTNTIHLISIEPEK